jgi:hypothetical protein
MIPTTTYWDEVEGMQKVRECTPAEIVEIEERKAAASIITVQQYTEAVQKHLDAKAQSKNYDDIVSACSYAGAPNPFQAEGVKFVEWRGNVWAKCYEVMALVQGGQRTAPTIEELIAELPTLVL